MYTGEILILTSPVFWILLLVTAGLCFLESVCSKKWIFVIGTVLLQTGAVIWLLMKGAILSELLLYLLAVLFVRLCFIMLERRKKG